MSKKESKHITSCTISWENTEDILSVVTKVFQTEKAGIVQHFTVASGMFVVPSNRHTAKK